MEGQAQMRRERRKSIGNQEKLKIDVFSPARSGIRTSEIEKR
jgi:hypothetical protein